MVDIWNSISGSIRDFFFAIKLRPALGYPAAYRMDTMSEVAEACSLPLTSI
jgi:hypothetical protein